MALNVAIGTFSASTSSGEQSVSVGFEPKVVLFFATARTSAGMTDDQYQHAVGWMHANGAMATDAIGAYSDPSYWVSVKDQTTNCLVLNDPSYLPGDQVRNAAPATTRFTSTTFAINWDTTGSATQINYIALGGSDITNVASGTFPNPNSGTPPISQAVTGLGFEPDLVFVHANVFPQTFPASGNSAWPSFGIASKDGASVQNTAISAIFSQAYSEYGHMRTPGTTNPRCLLNDATQNYWHAKVTSFDSGGFTLAFDGSDSSDWFHHYLAIKGITSKLGSITDPTSTGQQQTTGVGFQPQGLLLLGTGRAASESYADMPAQMNYGAGTSSSARFSISVGANGGNSYDHYQSHSASTIYTAYDDDGGTPTVVAQADLVSLDSGGFTLTWGTIDSTCVHAVIYWAFKGTATTHTAPAATGGAVTGGTATVSRKIKLLHQNFEGSGFDNGETWVNYAGDTGAANPDYATSPLLGSQSLHLKADDTEGTYAIAKWSTNTGILAHYGFFRLKMLALPPDTDSCEVHQTYNVQGPVDNPTNIEPHEMIWISPGGLLQVQTPGTTLIEDNLDGTALQVGTTYYIWYYFARTVGELASGWLKLATSGTQPGTNEIAWSNVDISGENFTYLGTNTIGFTTLHTALSGTPAYEYVIDQVIISEQDIGNVTGGTTYTAPAATGGAVTGGTAAKARTIVLVAAGGAVTGGVATTSYQAFGGTRLRYVDPDADAGGNGTTNELTGTNCAYDSLAAWEAALPSGTWTQVQECICDSTDAVHTADSSQPDISGWLSSATYYAYIHTPANSRHAGVWDATKYRLQSAVTVNGQLLRLHIPFVRIDGLQIAFSDPNGSYVSGITVWHQGTTGSATDDTRISNTIINGQSAHDQDADTEYFGIQLYSDVNDTYGPRVDVWNCIIYDVRQPTGGIGRLDVVAIGSSTNTATNPGRVRIYNCTIHNCNWAVATDAGMSGTSHFEVWNCIWADSIGGSYDIDYWTAFANGGYIATNMTEFPGGARWAAGGTNLHPGHTFSFVNEGADNFHLQSGDTGARDLGTSSVNGLFTTDIDGQTRTGTWDLGADEYVSEVSFLPQFWMPTASGAMTSRARTRRR